MLYDSDEDEEKVEKFKNYLAEVDIKYMTVVFGLLDIYINYFLKHNMVLVRLINFHRNMRRN